MIFAGILAGGSGTRMNMQNLPKQFLSLAGRPIIIRTLEKFLSIEEFTKIYIAIKAEWQDYFTSLLAEYALQTDERIVVLAGGCERAESLDLVLTAIESEYGRGHSIVTHDAVRPLISEQILREHLDGLKEHAMLDTVVPAVDTMIISYDGNFLHHIPERHHLYHSQTPQSFHIDKYREIYRSLSDEERAGLTDACKVFVLRDEPVYMVIGDAMNIKITTQADLAIAEALLRSTEKF